MLRFVTLFLIVSLAATSLGPAATAAAQAPAAGVVGGSCAQGDLHAALHNGGLVTFNCGVKTIKFSTPETISDNTIIDGGDLITLDGQEATRLFVVGAGVSLTLRHIVLQGARASFSDGDGGAISNLGALTLDHTTITDSATDNAKSGGAIFSSGPVTITNSLLHGNFGGSAGALFANFGNARVLISNSEFYSNHADNNLTGFGGAIWVGTAAQLTITSGSFHDQQAYQGGALYLSSGATVTISNASGATTFSANQAFVDGGAIDNQNGSLSITGAVLQSNHAPTNTVSGGQGGAIYSVGTLALQGAILQLNRARLGGALNASGNVSLAGTQILSNTTPNNGGGALITGGPAISGGLFRNNACTDGCGGGGLYVDGSPTLTGTQFISNSSYSSGGGIYALGGGSMTGGLFQDNRCVSVDCDGGGLASGGSLALNGTRFIGNTSMYAGGGAYADVEIAAQGVLFQNNQCVQSLCPGGGLGAGTLTLTDTQVISNAATGQGGGAWAQGSATLTGGLFQDNRCPATGCNGGGIYSAGTVALSGTAILSSTSGFDGGGIWAGGPVTLTDSLLQGNACTQGGCYGGGLLTQSSADLTRTRLTGNSAGSRGGGAYIGNATVRDGLFQDNRCQTGGCRGGGLYAGGTLVLTGTLFIHNSSAGDGGALYATNSAGVVNALFARNAASNAGAAILFAGAGSSTLLYDTIADPAAAGTAAIDIAAGTVGISDTIITSHTIGIQLAGGSAFEDYNLYFGTPTHSAGGVNSGGHSFNGNPVFADAAHDDDHLWTGSAAINQGVDVGVAVDVDGDPRPLHSGFDIGFDEFSLRRVYLAVVRR